MGGAGRVAGMGVLVRYGSGTARLAGVVREERSLDDGSLPSYDVITCSISGRLAWLALALCTGGKQ